MSEQPTPPQTCRILVLTAPQGVAAGFLPALRERASVRVTTTIDEALAALRDDQFDLVFTASSELLPLTRAAGHARAGTILEGIAQGVCIVARDGQLVWANAALRAYPPDVVNTLRQTCAGLADELNHTSAGDNPSRVRQRSLRVQGYCFDLSVSALPTIAGSTDEVIGLFSDTTAITRMREKLDAIDAAGQELVALNVDASESLDVGERLQLLEDKLIRCCRDLLDFTHFNVLVLDPKTRQLDTVLAGGFSEEAKAVNIHAQEEGNGISGYVAATGRSYICSDITSDPRYLPGFECAASSLTVPLRLLDRIVGVFNIESDKPAAFTDQDRQVVEVFGRYIAVALHTLKLLAVERSETAGQVTADVTSELASPLDGIVAEVSQLMEQAGGSEDTRRRLAAIIERVDRVKRIVEAVAKAPAIRGLVSDAIATDKTLKGKRVLVADDEEIIRETIADVLSKAGALVVMAKDGDEAIAMIHSQSFDLVLSDIKMPHRNGYEVFAAAKSAVSPCPVILITGFGYDPEHSIVRASREGLAAVLFKPFKVEQLLENIRKALGIETPKA